MGVWNGHYTCTCYHPLFVFNQFGDSNAVLCVPANVGTASSVSGVRNMASANV
jgi:hypothetical protein